MFPATRFFAGLSAVLFQAPMAGADDSQVKARNAALDHGAFQPLFPAEPPQATSRNAAEPLDRFILAKLRAAGLEPVGRADKRTLIRRAYFDLVGLPPPPEEIRTFVADRSPAALASQQLQTQMGNPELQEDARSAATPRD